MLVVLNVLARVVVVVVQDIISPYRTVVAYE